MSELIRCDRCKKELEKTAGYAGSWARMEYKGVDIRCHDSLTLRLPIDLCLDCADVVIGIITSDQVEVSQPRVHKESRARTYLGLPQDVYAVATQSVAKPAVGPTKLPDISGTIRCALVSIMMAFLLDIVIGLFLASFLQFVAAKLAKAYVDRLERRRQDEVFERHLAEYQAKARFKDPS